MTYVRKEASPLSAAEWAAFIDAIDQSHGVQVGPTTYDDHGRPA